MCPLKRLVYSIFRKKFPNYGSDDIQRLIIKHENDFKDIDNKNIIMEEEDSFIKIIKQECTKAEKELFKKWYLKEFQDELKYDCLSLLNGTNVEGAMCDVEGAMCDVEGATGDVEDAMCDVGTARNYNYFI